MLENEWLFGEPKRGALSIACRKACNREVSLGKRSCTHLLPTVAIRRLRLLRSFLSSSEACPFVLCATGERIGGLVCTVPASNVSRSSQTEGRPGLDRQFSGLQSSRVEVFKMCPGLRSSRVKLKIKAGRIGFILNSDPTYIKHGIRLITGLD